MKLSRSLSGKSTALALVLAVSALGSHALCAAPLHRVEARIELEGVGAIAGHLRRALPRHLAQELTRNPIDAPPGARLVVRVTEVFLSSDFGGGADDGGIMMDALDGEALILDARGAVLARKRVSGRMAPGGTVMDVASEPRRVEALAESLAYWAVRALR